MAERLKTKLLEEEQLVDLVVGPDAYRDLPNLLKETSEGRDAINVMLSKEETYADISPVRLGGNGVTAFVTITRGCDNMCTFCIVPFTRGRERSRDPYSIINECKELWDNGYKEITLLGQNVDSYLWYGGGAKKDFEKASAMQQATAIHFAELLEMVAQAVPNMRIRFATSNPQDMSIDVFKMMDKYPNICKYVHLPVQSGSDNMLKAMNRQHTRQEYLDLIKEAKKSLAFAKLNNCPTSPRKMRLVADLVRGQQVDKALAILKFNQKEAAARLEKLLRSAIANWQAKNEDANLEEAGVFIKEIRVDGGAILKRLRPAPQGRAHRIRKRSNHITLVLGAKNFNTES